MGVALRGVPKNKKLTFEREVLETPNLAHTLPPWSSIVGENLGVIEQVGGVGRAFKVEFWAVFGSFFP